ncbi:hypothetical protein [Pseudomonas reactans]|uniref:hypothetical protein n=1 Tax=Pseudomonas reactans TaxID=117680 RepID=UPI0015A17C77|nr:hypothetical protein [Pseudomonas reactans]NWC90002.1 hypothetical protein [Pseudomonas reactans]
MDFPKLEAVPAYNATTTDGRTVPFIISILLYDKEGKPRLTPAVERSIDRTVEVTGRVGLARATVHDSDNLYETASKYLERAMGLDGAIVLFRCESVELCERLMTHFNALYTLDMVQEKVENTNDEKKN